MTYEDYMRDYYPKLIFVKSKFRLEKPEDLKKENFIFDEDTKDVPEDATVMPLDVCSFPHVLAQSTALEAGIWGMHMCEQEGWAISRENIEVVLAKTEANWKA